MRLKPNCYHGCLLTAWLAAACSSHLAPTPTASPPPATSAEPTWPLLQQVKSWPASASRTVTSGGHAGEPYRAELRVNAESRNAYEKLVAGSTMSNGTLVAQFHSDMRGNPGPTFAMQKKANATQGSSWIFTVISPEGRVLRSGDLSDCARCHAEAVSDFLFGPPHSP